MKLKYHKKNTETPSDSAKEVGIEVNREIEQYEICVSHGSEC
jgi:hypothetical protein